MTLAIAQVTETIIATKPKLRSPLPNRKYGGAPMFALADQSCGPRGIDLPKKPA